MKVLCDRKSNVYYCGKNVERGIKTKENVIQTSGTKVFLSRETFFGENHILSLGVH